MDAINANRFAFNAHYFCRVDRPLNKNSCVSAISTIPLNLLSRHICLCGDVPASNYMGVFKEGVAFSLRKCRKCMATSNDMNTKVINSINQLHVNSIYSHTILLCLKSKPVGTQTKMCQCSYTYLVS